MIGRDKMLKFPGQAPMYANAMLAAVFYLFTKYHPKIQHFADQGLGYRYNVCYL